jgi:RNA-directed DNA polymerase
MKNSDALMNPTGGDDVWRADIKQALDNLMGRIIERNNVKKAWERVKSNRGAAGIEVKTTGMVISAGLMDERKYSFHRTR